MEKMKVLDLFAGIGGFSLGLERAGGFETVAFCEIEEFPRKVLTKHWPEAPQYHDVRKLTADILERDGISVDVITGGFPCQDISVAGKQAGIKEGTRSGLWFECKRLLGEIRPRYAIFENVSNLLSGPSDKSGGWFGRILCDLAEIGYDAEWHVIPASYVGAWHTRNRVWILAYPNKIGLKRGGKEPILRQCHIQKQPMRVFEEWGGRSAIAEPGTCRANNGFSDVSHRLAALGNAVIPQIPEVIGRAIMENEEWRGLQA